MMTQQVVQKRPLIGVGVLIVRDGRVLMGKRKGAHGSGDWGLPGGHLEFGESPEQCAIRETAEETGLAVQSVRRGTFTHDYFDAEGKHYITLYMVAECPTGEPQVLEPHKCECWHWFPWNQLPQPLFIPLRNLLKSGFSPLGS